jgi:hypothetical protein
MLALVSLFLPWFGAQLADRQQLFGGMVFRHVTITGQLTGVKAHGYLWIVFTLALLILALLVGRPALDRPIGPGSPRAEHRLPSLGQMLVALAGLNLVITLVGFLSKPGGVSLAILRISVSWRYGAVTALIFAALAVAAAVLNLRRQRGPYTAAPEPDVS